MVYREPNAASAEAGSVVVAFHGHQEREKFSNACGTGYDITQQPTEVIQGEMNTFIEGNPTLDPLGEDVLHVAEEVAGARECKCHGAELF